MIPRTRLIWASVFFGVSWTAAMIWWTGTETANIVAFTIGGAIAGVVWFHAMRWWSGWAARRQAQARRIP